MFLIVIQHEYLIHIVNNLILHFYVNILSILFLRKILVPNIIQVKYKYINCILIEYFIKYIFI